MASTEEIDITMSSKDQIYGSKPKSKVTGRLLLAVFSAVMGSVQFGFNTGVINAPEETIKQFMNETNYGRFGEAMSADTAVLMYSLLVAIFAVGGMVGGLLAGWWATFFGRKFGMILNSGFGIGAAVLMFFSRLGSSYEMVIAGRCLVGFNCGLYTGLTPLYLSEIGSANNRGALGTLHQLGVTIGILTSQILGFPEILGNEGYWHVLLGLCAVPPILQLLSMPFCPESPRYLLITKEKREDAHKALVALRGTADVDSDLDEMENEYQHEQREGKISWTHLLRKRSLWKPLIISIVMHLSQQFSGITAVFYYSTKLYVNAGIHPNTAAHATSGIGAIMVTMTLITIPLMDRVGRRTLHLLGIGGMFIFSVLITVTLALKDTVDWFRIANIVVSLLYVVFFAVGPGSIPWLIVAELFSQGPRPAAMSISVVINWIANFSVGYAFPSMQKGLGDYSFLPFTVMLLFFWIFVYIYLPETKNKTFEEISENWKSMKNSIGKKEDTPKENTHLSLYSKQKY